MSVPSPATKKLLTRLRLYAQRISATELTTPGQLVRHMLAMQAQDFVGAKWSVGLRLPGVTDADVERALAQGEIVRSWPMRGTLHLVAPEDLRWMLSVTAPRILAGAAQRHHQLGLTTAQFERAREMAVTALSGQKSLTRDELQTLFAHAGISPEGQRGYHLLWYLAQTGTLCFGPTRGKQQTFVLLAEWVASGPALQPEEALAEFARRYFHSHGPATIADFAWWASLSLTEARVGVAAAGASLHALTLEGTTYYLARQTASAAELPPGATYALPGFDEYLLGYKDRSAALSPAHKDAIVPGGNGVFMPTLLANGAVIGTWKRVLKRKEVVAQALPFGRLTAQTRAGFARAIAAYGAYLGLPARVLD